jgi:hypothetical protein
MARGIPFEKGKPKTGGKEKGTPNKKTMVLETFCQDIIDGGMSTFSSAMSELAEKNPKLYVDAYLSLLEYVKPKLARHDTSVTTKGELNIIWKEERTYEQPKED